MGHQSTLRRQRHERRRAGKAFKRRLAQKLAQSDWNALFRRSSLLEMHDENASPEERALSDSIFPIAPSMDCGEGRGARERWAIKVAIQIVAVARESKSLAEDELARTLADHCEVCRAYVLECLPHVVEIGSAL